MSIRSSTNRLVRFLLYAWAAPATVVGCCIGVFFPGATWRVKDGVVEVAGGRIACAVRLLPRAIRFDAITFGHIVLGMNREILEIHRLHEHTHVRQYERWGIFFFPLYLGSSLIQLLRGRHPHRDNHFEREAFTAAHNCDDHLEKYINLTVIACNENQGKGVFRTSPLR